ncbi:hypothetical protein GALL_257430 [mine drainage metagenome]|uniref:Uncharacterized protein n=1 Tax=mine drainage metagenome TaxID=410659 RepID=A0A1J5RW15_9ZZZZ
MRNVTLSVPDDIYRMARVAAAKQDTTISAVAAESLRAYASGEDPQKVRRRLFEKAFAAVGNNQGQMSSRDDLYDRRILSRH